MNLETLGKALAACESDTERTKALQAAGLYNEADLDKAIATATGGLAEELSQTKRTMTELKDAVKEFKRPEIFGDADANGNRDNGAAGTGSKGKAIIRSREYFDPVANRMKRTFEYETLGAEQKEFLRRFIESARTGQPTSFRGDVNPVTPGTKALSEGSNPAGGFTVFGESMAGILEIMAEDSELFNRVQRIQLGTDSMSAAQLVQTFGSSPSYFGGVTWSWQGEAATISESTNPSYQLRELRAKKVVGLHIVSRELMADNPAFMTHITNLLGRAYAYEVDNQLWNGDGITEPLGLLNAPGTNAVSATTSSSFKVADITNLDAAIDEQFDGLVYFARKATYMDIPDDFAPGYSGATEGMPKATIMFNDLSAPLGRWRTLNGYEAVVTKHAKALGTAGNVVLMDPRSILLGLRQDLEIATSFDAYFTTDQMGVRLTARMDAQPIYPAGIAILGA